MKAYRAVVSAVCIAMSLVAGGAVQAQERGSAGDARAMLERAVAAVKTDEAKALAEFKSGGAGFRDRDLYVFCARRDGVVDAHIDPPQIGRNIKDLYDVDGVAFGQEMMAIATEGEIKAVSYMWPEPGSRVPTAKISFVTRAAGQMCGVGYYK
jgi:signal transduction histidine kinase